MPQCQDFTSVLVSELLNSSKATRPDLLAPTLAVMQVPDIVGLGSMPPKESSVAALVSPVEALSENVCCPSVECKCTDELLSHAYNSTATLGHISNSMAHMRITLHSSLNKASSDPLVTDLSELFLQAMSAIASHCGTALGTFV